MTTNTLKQQQNWRHIQQNWMLIAACKLMALGILCGAFGAHALKAKLAPVALDWWHTGTLYLMVNSLGLLALGILNAVKPQFNLNKPALLLLLGMLLFAGSLYALALGAARFVGMITPIGGISMVVAWYWCAWGFLTLKAK